MRFRSAPSTVQGVVQAPPSKSYTHRAILMAALSGGPSRVQRPLLSEDTEATVAGIEAFGAAVRRDVHGLLVRSSGLRTPSTEVDAGNSGTTLRLLSGTAALVGGPTILTGDATLRKRPIAPLLEGLEALGARARSFAGDGCPPVEVRGILRGGAVAISGAMSSQFLSSLLIAAPMASGMTVLSVLPPIRSEPYVAITLAMLRHFGIQVQAKGTAFEVRGNQSFEPTDFMVPGDFSSAAFPLVAAAISGGDVTVEALDFSLPQGDRRILDLLSQFGARVDVFEDRVRLGSRELVAQEVDVNDIPDLFPALAVLATQAKGVSRFVNGEHLRFKESNRIEATTAFLKAMGADVTPAPDGCVVRGPSRLRGAFVDSRGDHRILMAAAVAGLVAEDAVEITDPWCFRVSYPTFLDDFRGLGASMEVTS